MGNEERNVLSKYVNWQRVLGGGKQSGSSITQEQGGCNGDGGDVCSVESSCNGAGGDVCSAEGPDGEGKTR